jgi:hypothetical protein
VRQQEQPPWRRERPERASAAEAGQIVPLVAVVLLLAVAAVAGLAKLGAREAGRARAQAVADAVALAGAEHDEAMARLVADANGAGLVRFERAADLVQVEVRWEGSAAMATAMGREAGGAGEPPARDPPLVSSGRADGQ